MTENLLGSVAGLLTTVAFLPQLLKTVRTKATKDISLVMYVVFAVGVSLWLAYGIMLGSPPIIAANAVTLLLVLSVLFWKLKYG